METGTDGQPWGGGTGPHATSPSPGPLLRGNNNHEGSTSLTGRPFRPEDPDPCSDPEITQNKQTGKHGRLVTGHNDVPCRLSAHRTEASIQLHTAPGQAQSSDVKISVNQASSRQEAGSSQGPQG